MHLTPHLFHSHHDLGSERALLGPGHRLVRVSDRLALVRAQLMVVGVLLSASAVALVAGDAEAVYLTVAATVVELVLACAVAMLTQLEHDHARELIIEGRGGLPIAAVQRQRRRLVEPATRLRLARSLDEIRQPSEHPLQPRLSTRLLCSARTIAAVAPDLADAAALLRGEHAGLRGIAMAERLLCDGASALYGQDAEALRQELRRIRILLVG